MEQGKSDNQKPPSKKGFLKRYGLGYILQGIPIVGILGDISMPNIRLVLRETKGNLMSPDGLLMIVIACLADTIKLVVSLIELAIGVSDLSIVSTILGWLSWMIFGFWMYMRKVLPVETGQLGDK